MPVRPVMPMPATRRVAAGAAALAAVVSLGVGPGSVPSDARTAAAQPQRHHGWFGGYDNQGVPVELLAGPHHVSHFSAGTLEIGPGDVEHGHFRVCHEAGCYVGYWSDDATIVGAWHAPHHRVHVFQLHPSR